MPPRSTPRREPKAVKQTKPSAASSDQIQAWAATPRARRRPKRRAGGRAAVERQIQRLATAMLAGRPLCLAAAQRQPAYAAVLVATMALGVAATTVLGSVTYGVLLKPLPWANAPRLVRLYETRQGSTRRLLPIMTNATFVEWRNAADDARRHRRVVDIADGGQRRRSAGTFPRGGGDAEPVDAPRGRPAHRPLVRRPATKSQDARRCW